MDTGEAHVQKAMDESKARVQEAIDTGKAHVKKAMDESKARVPTLRKLWMRAKPVCRKL